MTVPWRVAAVSFTAVAVLVLTAPAATDAVTVTDSTDVEVIDCAVTENASAVSDDGTGVQRVTVWISTRLDDAPTVSVWSRKKRTRHAWNVSSVTTTGNGTVVTAVPRTPFASPPRSTLGVTVRFPETDRRRTVTSRCGLRGDGS